MLFSRNRSLRNRGMLTTCICVSIITAMLVAFCSPVCDEVPNFTVRHVYHRMNIVRIISSFYILAWPSSRPTPYHDGAAVCLAPILNQVYAQYP